MSDFNRKYYEYLARLVTEDERDIDFICNRMASAYQKINDNCIDNFRICRASGEGGTTFAYECDRANGCCAEFDKLINNELTGSSFWFGFNYNH